MTRNRALAWVVGIIVVLGILLVVKTELERRQNTGSTQRSAHQVPAQKPAPYTPVQWEQKVLEVGETLNPYKDRGFMLYSAVYLRNDEQHYPDGVHGGQACFSYGATGKFPVFVVWYLDGQNMVTFYPSGYYENSDGRSGVWELTRSKCLGSVWRGSIELADNRDKGKILHVDSYGISSWRELKKEAK